MEVRRQRGGVLIRGVREPSRAHRAQLPITEESTDRRLGRDGLTERHRVMRCDRMPESPRWGLCIHTPAATVAREQDGRERRRREPPPCKLPADPVTVETEAQIVLCCDCISYVEPDTSVPWGHGGAEDEGSAGCAAHDWSYKIVPILLLTHWSPVEQTLREKAQQPLAVRPPFDRIAQPLVEPAEWPWLSEQPLSPEARLRARYLALWQRDFDYVLLIDAPADVQPHPALSLLHRGNYAQLYRVNRP